MSTVSPTSASVKTTIAETFDGAARTYDTIGPEYFARFGRRLVELADIEPGMRVLDVGCGAGAALVPAARAAGPGGHVLGIDISSAMLDRARASIAKAELTNAEVRSGDAEIPGVGPGDRDRILAAQVLFFLPDLAQALRAYRHILKPGGRLALSSWGPDEKRWQAVHKVMFASIPDGCAPSLTPSGAVFRSDETVAATLEEYGFVDVHSVTETYDVVFESPDQWLSWTRSHGGRAYWDAIPAPRRATARNEAASVLRRMTDSRGRLTVATTVRYTVATRP